MISTCAIQVLCILIAFDSISLRSFLNYISTHCFFEYFYSLPYCILLDLMRIGNTVILTRSAGEPFYYRIYLTAHIIPESHEPQPNRIQTSSRSTSKSRRRMTMAFLHLQHPHRDCGDRIPNRSKNPHLPECHRRRRDMRPSALVRLSGIFSRADRLGIMRRGSGS